MRRMSVYALFVFAAVLICSGTSVAQTVHTPIPIHINSGNPAFPFPQFLPYAHPNGDTLHNLGTLALSRDPAAKTANAGVTHAELEQAGRDAYRIMMNRAVYTPVRGVEAVSGTRYIWYHSDCGCSEGDGYGLLAAAMMADKATFDGMWLWIHDHRMNNVVRYGDGTSTLPYNYSTLPTVYAGANGNENSAADGDYDVAMALMIAHMQWGDLMGINDSRGNPISYKNDFLKVAKGLTDTLAFNLARERILSGSIGLDGYFKGGDSWQELTGWSSSQANLVSIGISPNRMAESRGPRTQFISYTAPSYFRQFAKYLKRDQEQNSGADHAWNIFQFERAEASSEWLQQKHYEQDQRNIPFAGNVTMINDTTPHFTSEQHGEDFRTPWRTILSYVWHGNPEYTWDPVRHVVVRDRSNTYMRDVGRRYARFLWDRRQSPWNQGCNEMIGAGQWWGPPMLKSQYSPQGAEGIIFLENWVHGTGTPAAVTSQNFDLMAEMYRQMEIEWNIGMIGAFDENDPHTRYLGSRPFYFHGFFRVLGMMIMTGNHHAPLNMTRTANMKVYLDVDKTYAFENDTITYTIDYRNYGALDAENVVITNRLNQDFVYVAGSGGASATYNQASHAVEWRLGNVPGFRSATGIDPTKGTVSFKIFVPNANQKRYENRVEITCSNGTGWVSDEYPNVISSVMKRNGFDIAKRALQLEHTVYRDTVNPGMTATFTIDFENSAEAGWLNGGRPGVNFSYSHLAKPALTDQHTFMIRLFNDAHEAYIDYGNYRISYFLFDNNITSLEAWRINTDIAEGFSTGDTRLGHDMITPGQDSRGSWNQRLIVQTADVHDPNRAIHLATTTPHLITYFGSPMRVKRGLFQPFKGVWRLHNSTFTNRNWGNDWSYNPQATGNTGSSNVEDWGYPISPDFTESYDPDYQGRPVTRRHRKLCEPNAAVTVNNILIEEWDGYTWRRVFGNGPIPGREVLNVVIRDTLPQGITFQGFVGANPLGIAPTYNPATRVISWEIDKLLVGQGGKIQYTVVAETPPVSPIPIRNRAWISGNNESPLSGTAVLVITLDSLPPPPPIATTMYKTADKASYSPQDTIAYTIAYKQTHGYTANSTSSSQWTGSGLSVSGNGETITFGGSNVNMNFTPSYGTNVTLTGTVNTVSYGPVFRIFGRSDNSGNRVEVAFWHDWAGVICTVISNGRVSGDFMVERPHAGSVTLDYKFVFRADTLLLWVGDTSAALPYATHTGIGTQAGYAGVRYTGTGGGGGATITGWRTRTDLAYEVTIRDTIPRGLTLIPGSITGQFNTGSRAPQAITGTYANGVITWPVVTGMNIPQSALGANDSLTVRWRAVVDTAYNRVIVNTAYTDLASYRTDSIGSQVRSRFTLPGDTTIVDPPDTTCNPAIEICDTDTLVPPPNGLYVTVEPRSCIFTGSISVSVGAFIETNPAVGSIIYYTRNGSVPDAAFVGMGTEVYTGQPLVFSASGSAPPPVTFRAMAVKYDTLYDTGGGMWTFHEESTVITRVYEPLRTVPISSAAFIYNENGRLATGVNLIMSAARQLEPDTAVIWRHMNLIDISGTPVYDFIRVYDDTLRIFFRGEGITVPVNPRLTIREPQLPGTAYTSAHGYLAAGEITINHVFIPPPPPTVYTLSAGPNPFRRRGADNTGELSVFIASRPHQENIDAQVRIYDRLGNIVAISGPGGNITEGTDNTRWPPRQKYTWNGTNRRGRIVGNGAYMVHVVITEPNGEKIVLRQIVNFVGR